MTTSKAGEGPRTSEAAAAFPAAACPIVGQGSQLFSYSDRDALPIGSPSLVPEEFVVAAVVVVGQPQEGNAQPDDCRRRQEHKNEKQRLIQLRQMLQLDFVLPSPLYSGMRGE